MPHKFKYFILAFLILEIGARLTRITDFPIYEANNKIGYIPKASQQGKFLWSHNWTFNEYHMGADTFNPSNAEDILLIGDSIVLGGNPLKESERLGPTLQRKINRAVWPISAGSWSMRNQLIYLNGHPDVVKKIDTFIFVWNSGDFDQASSWSCEITHPKQPPISAFLYAFQKYVYSFKKCNGEIKPEYLVASGDWHNELKGFINSAAMKNKKVVAYLYPDINELKDSYLMKQMLDSHIDEVHEAGIKNVISVGYDPRWGLSNYRDGIHPSGVGNRMLADIIANPHGQSAF
jgi:hypothetical protein